MMPGWQNGHAPACRCFFFRKKKAQAKKKQQKRNDIKKYQKAGEPSSTKVFFQKENL